MGKAVLIIATTVLAPIALFCVNDALAARSTSPKMASDECDERKGAGASLASAAPSFDIRLPKPNILKRKRRYIRM
jgi:hypothetical protein